MIVEYLKAAFRALSNHRLLSFVNLFGLSIGLAAVISLGLFVRHELGHDRFLEDHQTLFRMDTIETIPDRESLAIARAPGPLREALKKDFPQVEAVTRAYTARLNLRIGAQGFAEPVLVVDPDFFTVLGLPFAQGDRERALIDPGSIVLSERAAEKFFGRDPAVGRQLTLLVPEPRTFTVTALFKTIPEASHLDFDLAIPHSAYFRPSSDGSETIPESWAGAYFHTYVRLRHASDLDVVQRGLPAFTDRHLPQWITDQLKVPAHEFFDFRLVPVRDVHFEGASLEAMKPASSRTTVAALAGVALLILVIAAINFANLTAARTLLRSREIALRKVVGARRQQIVFQFLVEAILLTAIAGLTALVLVELFRPWLGQWLPGGDSLPTSPGWDSWVTLLILVLATAGASGLYPCLLASSVAPAEVFRGDRANAGAGRLRAGLVLVQFAISIALIVVTLAMAMQTRFARNLDLGFDRQNLLIVRVPAAEDSDDLARRFRDSVLRNPQVQAAALSSAVPSDPSEDNISVTRPQALRPIQLGYHQVDGDFFATYRVTPLAGQSRSMRGGEVSDAVINISAARRLGIADPGSAVGQQLRTSSSAFNIVGVVPDLHFRSIHEPVRDEIFAISENPGGVVSIRYRTGNISAFLAEIDRTWNALAPDKPIDREFLDEAIDQLYEREQSQLSLLSLFAAIAILLSCLGLFAMVAFAVQRRRREMALRRVLGARPLDIAGLLLWQFSRPVIVANLVAWPVAWLIVSNWLNRFAFRIDMPIMAFVAASAAALLIALAAIAVHSFRAAWENPAGALREL
jgi:putative ABC transport system permease protein